MKNFFIKIKDSFMNYLERMEKVNKNLYGNGKPDCCNLNSNFRKKEKSAGS